MMSLDLALTNEQVKAFQPVLKMVRDQLVKTMSADGLTPAIEDQITKSLPVLSQIERRVEGHLQLLSQP